MERVMWMPANNVGERNHQEKPLPKSPPMDGRGFWTHFSWLNKEAIKPQLTLKMSHTKAKKQKIIKNSFLSKSDSSDFKNKQKLFILIQKIH